MYNGTPKIRDNYEKDHFEPYIEHIAAQLAKNDADAALGGLDTYTESYKQLLTQLLGETPTVYYEALKKCFGLGVRERLENHIDTENFPIDLTAELNSHSPEGFLQLLQYINEADVIVKHPDAAVTFYDTELSYIEAQREIDKIMNEEEEELTDGEYAERLGVPLSALSQKIGKKADCAALSYAVGAVVKERLGLEDFDLSREPSPEAMALYNELMSDIEELPAVCYGMLHAVATDRNIPTFYDTHETEYSAYEPQAQNRDALLADKFSLALHSARNGAFGIRDAAAAKKYFELYSSLEPVTRTAPKTAENAEKRLKEALEDADRQHKLQAKEKDNAKKENTAKFNDFISRLGALGNLTKAEHDFLSTQAKIYAKENALLDKATKKYEDAAHALNRLRITEDIRDLTPKEQKAMAKATATAEKAEAELNALKDKLIEGTRQRDTSKFPEHAILREEQIRSGDTTYVPLHTREDSINQGMYGYRAKIYSSDRREMLEPSVTAAEGPERATEGRSPITGLGIGSTTRQVRASERDRSEQERIAEVIRGNADRDKEPDIAKES